MLSWSSFFVGFLSPLQMPRGKEKDGHFSGHLTHPPMSAPKMYIHAEEGQPKQRYMHRFNKVTD